MKMFGAPPERKDPKLPRPVPTVRNDGQPPPQQQLAPRGRRLAEEAAQVRQEVIDLQDQLTLTENERADLLVQVQVLQRENARIKEEMAALSVDRNQHRDRVMQIEAEFASIAELLVRVLDRRRKPPQTEHMSVEDEIQKLAAQDHEAPR